MANAVSRRATPTYWPKLIRMSATARRDVTIAEVGAWKNYQVNIQEVIPGTCVIDYKPYLRELSQLPVDAPLMPEHLRNGDEYTSPGLSFGAAIA